MNSNGLCYYLMSWDKGPEIMNSFICTHRLEGRGNKQASFLDPKRQGIWDYPWTKPDEINVSASDLTLLQV